MKVLDFSVYYLFNILVVLTHDLAFSLIGLGCPAKKLALGLPFYGRDAKNPAQPYAQLIQARSDQKNDDRIDGFAFNGPTTIKRKVDFAFARQLSGVMIWELGQDSARPEVSLLTTIRQRVQESRRIAD